MVRRRALLVFPTDLRRPQITIGPCTGKRVAPKVTGLRSQRAGNPRPACGPEGPLPCPWSRPPTGRSPGSLSQHGDHRRRLGPLRPQRHALRPRPARGGAAGRAGAGDRGAAGGRGGGVREPAGSLLDAALGVREPARPARAVRPVLPHLLARPAAARADDAPAAADAGGREAAGRAGGGQPARGRGPEPARAGHGRRRAGGGAARARAGRGADLVEPRAAAGQGFRADDRPRSWRRRGARSAGCGCRSCRWRRGGSGPRRMGGGSTCAGPCASRCAAAAAAIDIARQGAAQAASAAGDPVRHLGLDEPLLAHAAAVHARDHQRPRPGALLPVRHPADQRHPPAAQPRHRPGAGADRRRWSRTGPAGRGSAPA